MKKWKCLKSDLVYDSRYFRVRKDVVVLPNKGIKEWTYWDSRNSAMVVAMTRDKKLVMIRQYRYLVGGEVIEFPSGGLKENEEAEDAARREFKEETGFVCESLIKLGSFYETYGQLNRQIHLFFTNDVNKVERKSDSGDDVVEKTRVVLMDFDKVVNLAMKNKIVAMGSSLAILLLKEKILRGEIKI